MFALLSDAFALDIISNISSTYNESSIISPVVHFGFLSLNLSDELEYRSLTNE
jgi:hypothetical protein